MHDTLVWLLRVLHRLKHLLGRLSRPPLYSMLGCLHKQRQQGCSVSVTLGHHLFTLLSVSIMLRSLATSASLFLKSDLYFRFDLLNRIIFLDSGLDDHFFALYGVFLPLFALNLYWQFFVNLDPLVGEFLYDIVVRNRNQSQITLNWRAFPRLLCITTPKTARLVHFNELSRSARRNAIAISLAFEVAAYLGLACCLILAWASSFYYTRNRDWLSKVVLFIDCLGFSYFGYHLMKSCIFLMSTALMFLHVYAMLYTKLNRQLKALLAGPTTGRVRRILAAYRRQHVHLTAVLLHLNAAFTAQVLAHFRHYMLPLHAYSVVLLYFESKLDHFITLELHCSVVLFTFIPAILIVSLLLLNKRISSSAHFLSTIFAQQSTFCQPVDLRQTIKLATYYELIWRLTKPLGFTTGELGRFINSKCALDALLQYYVYVLYFGAKFIAKRKTLL